jgi:hypothetical protein
MMQWFAPLVILLLFALLSAVSDRNPEPLRQLQGAQQAPKIETQQKTDRAEESKAKSDRQTHYVEDGKVAVENSHSPYSQRESNSDAHQGTIEASENWTVLGRSLKITDTLLCVFTFVLCIIGWWQGRQLKRTVGHMEESAESQLRAYVFQEIGGWRNMTNGLPLGLNIALVNKGQTPAKNAWVAGTINILPFPLPDDFDFLLDEPGIKQRFNIPPNQSRPAAGWIIATRSFSPQEIEEVTSGAGRCRAWAYGVITYEDIFGKKRHTRFCWFLDPLSVQYKWTLSGGKEIDTWVWASHSKHTDFD